MSYSIQALGKEQAIESLTNAQAYGHKELLEKIKDLIKEFPVPDGTEVIVEAYGHNDAYCGNCDIKIKTYRK